MIRRFEERSGCIEDALSGKQWARLKDVVSEQTAEREPLEFEPSEERSNGKLLDSSASANKKGQSYTQGFENMIGAELAHGSVETDRPLPAETLKENPCHPEAGLPESDQKTRKRKQNAGLNAASVNAHRSTAADVYTPNSKIRALPDVQQKHEAITLQCSKCAKEITGRWYFTAAGRKHDQTRILFPNMGHKKCGGMRRSNNGLKTIHDVIGNLDVCPHRRLRIECIACGGSKAHRKRENAGLATKEDMQMDKVDEEMEVVGKEKEAQEEWRRT
eukprot:gnl/MRDRNA2_/MRDRNA2_186981_c0_seq1.p1 gnl/MRDRNA2_/MRDRNA2_186981_c0~~gnl/MRDRNA2_/MRDRNA2_186981_c0_seq1.p1  ORF type:complete len:275 (-),score=69.71 gnl/MRDRNA2_/MRDRNA2_186981_c0_seq1:357-1181(-)